MRNLSLHCDLETFDYEHEQSLEEIQYIWDWVFFSSEKSPFALYLVSLHRRNI